jgi:hypothetical protein
VKYAEASDLSSLVGKRRQGVSDENNDCRRTEHQGQCTLPAQYSAIGRFMGATSRDSDQQPKYQEETALADGHDEISVDQSKRQRSKDGHGRRHCKAV